MSNTDLSKDTDDITDKLSYENDNNNNNNDIYDIFNKDDNEEQEKNIDEDDEDDESMISTLSENDVLDDEINYIQKNNKKYNYLSIKKYVDDFFNSSVIYKYSCALDILSSYLKGQKIIYNESRTLYKYYLNILMITCIILSSTSTIFSQIDINNETTFFYKYHSLILSSMNALITCIISCISYLKLDACCESFKICSHKFEKIEKEITFLSGEVLLFNHPCLEEINYYKNEKIFNKLNILQPNSNKKKKEENKFMFYKQYFKKYNYEELKLIDELKTKIQDIKKKIIEIEESNQFPIPKKVQNDFSIIYHTNIFTIIKKIDDYKTKMIMKLKNIKNEINYYKNKRETILEEGKKDEMESIEEKMNLLFKKKYKTIEKILFIKTSFLIIDNIFQQEIKNSYIKKNNIIRFFLIRTFGDFFPNCILCSLYPKNYKDPRTINKEIYDMLFEPLIYNEESEYDLNKYHL